MYDYVSVLYPEGVVAFDKTIVFNHKQIKEVFFVGYTKNEEEKTFKHNLISKLKEYRSNAKKDSKPE